MRTFLFREFRKAATILSLTKQTLLKHHIQKREEEEGGRRDGSMLLSQGEARSFCSDCRIGGSGGGGVQSLFCTGTLYLHVCILVYNEYFCLALWELWGQTWIRMACPSARTWAVTMMIFSSCRISLNGLRPLAWYLSHGLMKKYFSFLRRASSSSSAVTQSPVVVVGKLWLLWLQPWWLLGCWCSPLPPVEP